MTPERDIQRAVRRYIALRGYTSAHVPNGAVLAGDRKQRAMQMNALKRDGLMVGFPDLIIFGTKTNIGFMEVKAPDGPISQSQSNVQNWLEGLGHNVAIVRSVDDAKAALHAWGWI